MNSLCVCVCVCGKAHCVRHLKITACLGSCFISPERGRHIKIYLGTIFFLGLGTFFHPTKEIGVSETVFTSFLR